MIELDLLLTDRSLLHVHDTGPVGADEHVVVYHHGTPNTGEPPAPLLERARALGLRLVGYDRPGYGGSTARPDRPVSSAAALAARVADHLEVDRFAVLGHSGGGPHALACAALLPGRVSAAVVVASLAPYDAPGLAYLDGMGASGAAALTAAVAGRETKERHDAEHGESYDPEFCEADLAAFGAEWGWFMGVVRAGAANGPAPAIEDDLAYVRPWGFEVATIAAPTLVLHGGRDRIAPPAHGAWLARTIPGAELRAYPEDGHISVLTHGADALDWLAARVG